MRVVFRSAVLGAIALLASGCAILGGSPEHEGGTATLRQAAKAASDSSGKQRRMNVGDEVPEWARSGGPEVETSLTVGGGERPRRSDGDFTNWQLGVIAGGGSLAGHEFEGFGVGGIDVGAFVSRRWRFDLAALGLEPNLTQQSVAGQGLKNEFELALDLSGRFYLNPPHTFMAVYPVAGVRAGTLFWDYRNAVTVIANGAPRRIADDYINYYAIYGGIGVALARGRHFSLDGELTGGGRTYDADTYEGFHNDLFPATGFSQLAFTLSYRF